MAKGDDALARKKNKLTRKKMSRKNDSATVSARIASIIAAKKRRKSGKRSMCQGMCFSLPTPEDPFNERQSKVDIAKRKTKKVKTRDSEKGSSRPVGNNKKDKEDKKPSPMSIDGDDQKPICENMDGPRKFLMLCLNEIETLLRMDGTYTDDQDDKSLFTTWGIEFWKCFSSGNDILETSGKASTIEQIAWIVSAAADAIATREKEGQDESLGNSPFLLFLVPYRSKASKVRSVCKALKRLGIHTVSLHEEASLDHQISGLKSCEPEFLVSTPERLLEIVNLKGVDISGVSILVVDQLSSLCNAGYQVAVESIKKAISSKHQTIVFNDSFRALIISAVQSLLRRSINRLSLSGSVASQGSCIFQNVNICVSKEKKLQMFAEILDSTSSKPIHIVTKEENFRKFKALLKLNGHSVSLSANSDSKIPQVKKSRGKPLACLIDIEQLDSTVMRDFETVILPDFVPSIEIYIQILTSMARYSVRGVLHSFITITDTVTDTAGPLLDVLRDCGQHVPFFLWNLYPAL